MSTGRVEALSDGVLAIAATLLVLDLKVPQGAGDDLLGAVLGQWPAYLGYVVSFLTIGIIWVNHPRRRVHWGLGRGYGQAGCWTHGCWC